MSQRRPRSCRVGVEGLEDRVVMANDAVGAEVYTWSLVNAMRANPQQFAADIQALATNQPGTYQGYTADDPVWVELREQIGNNNPGSGWSLSQPLNFLRGQPALPAFLLQDDLSNRAADHTRWMKDYGFAHTGTATRGQAIPGFTPTAAAAPDAFNHDATRYGGPRGESINYGYNSRWAFAATYAAGGISRDGYIQRLAYLETMSYVLDIGLPNLGHLRNLFGRPDGMQDGLTGPLSVSNFDSIGIDVALESVGGDPNLPDEYISTMRFDNVRVQGPKPGEWAGMTFDDANGNALYDVGEAYQLQPAVAPPAPPAPPPAPDPGTPAPVAVPPVTVALAPRVQQVSGVRTKKGLASVVVRFDGPLDANAAADLGAYTLTLAKPGAKARQRPVRLRAARYDAATNLVTLTLAKPLTEAGRVRIAVAGSLVSQPFSGVVRR